MNKNILVLTLVAELLTCALAAISYSRAGEIENLGVPVKSVSIMGMVKGHDANNEEVLYFSCGQPGSRFFLLQVNPASGKSRQFDSPSGEGAHGLIVGPDECVYLGTWGNGLLLKFDPRQPETGVVALGKPASSESYIWQFAVGSDGRVYGCTYPQARLIRYDVKSFILEDLGRLDDREMYARSIAASRNGSLYIGIGTVRAQIVRFDPATGSRVSLLADDQRPPGTAMVGRAGDGEVYARIEGKAFHCDGDKLRSVTSVPAPDIVRLGDGTIPDEARAERGRLIYKLTRKDGQSFEQQADFQGVGIQIFSLSAGPEGNIYGSSILPLEIFKFVPARGDLSDLGTSNGAEVYSFATDGKLLYSCAYPGGYLSIYNPKEDWSFGEHARSNPRGVGKMGDGHLRPRAMIMGKDGRVYVGSLPPYGQVGGALGEHRSRRVEVAKRWQKVASLLPGIIRLEKNCGKQLPLAATGMWQRSRLPRESCLAFHVLRKPCLWWIPTPFDSCIEPG